MRRMKFAIIILVSICGSALWLLAQSLASSDVSPNAAEKAAAQRLLEWRRSRVTLADDWGELARYRADDDRLATSPADRDRVVFFGDSITDYWDLEKYFPGKPYVNRGISGQTTSQMLVRFRQDVIALHPRAVVILAGSNDIAGNTGPMRDEEITANLASMADLARANKIQVIFGSVTPVHNFTPSSQGYFYTRPLARIVKLNNWLKEYCAANSLIYIDYYSAMVGPDGMLRRELADDGLHPTSAGYQIMSKLASDALKNPVAMASDTVAK
ncbi:MAG TPA: SGNH/GDSL hydrolase family protein [Candidatus Acidoferrales bacterium]|nr:SGNH/GDSL hydrolase family protein [Candidatus Acidoferrales bacterium]